MTTPAGTYASAPRWRVLAILSAMVLIAHTLILKSSPARFEPQQEALQSTQAFVTRSIALPPAPAAAPATPPTPPKPRVSKRKPPPVQEQPAQPAIDLIANPPSEAATSSAPSPMDTVDSAPPEEVTAAIPPAPVASAPAAPASPSHTPVTSMVLPESVRLEYKMTGSAKGLNYHANAELGWRYSGDSYDAFMRVSALFLGSRSMASTGQVGPEGLAPRRFSDKSRSEVAAHFEPDKGLIVFSTNTPAAPWVRGAQDRVSVFLQLGGMLAGNPAGFPSGTTISIYTVGPRDADTWTFLVEAEEKLTLPFGEVATVKLTRQPRREFDQKVEIWYAPSLSYLPVRNKITQSNGDFVDQQLSALNRG